MNTNQTFPGGEEKETSDEVAQDLLHQQDAENLTSYNEDSDLPDSDFDDEEDEDEEEED